MSNVWFVALVPAATILTPALVGCLTALQISRTLTRTWSTTFNIMASKLDAAAQSQPSEPTPAVSTPQAGGRHSARQARRPR
ncbi:hypothetical protein AQJ46_45525 [Streptomyces canus]|uniref:Uncharacterized protein n=1 Tax=Streptomyces canus TaxID=58343 RepID=A0A101RLE8_9ACTN|nr:hypothetical protein [Streptomyces canus]KUN57789.1 hypothetical protein AQJ46_45525 [Streptomyces canus]